VSQQSLAVPHVSPCSPQALHLDVESQILVLSQQSLALPHVSPVWVHGLHVEVESQILSVPQQLSLV
jgi:hypothetical protein